MNTTDLEQWAIDRMESQDERIEKLEAELCQGNTFHNANDVHYLMGILDLREQQIAKLEAALRCCIPADGEAARLKHEALLQQA